MGLKVKAGPASYGIESDGWTSLVSSKGFKCFFIIFDRIHTCEYTMQVSPSTTTHLGSWGGGGFGGDALDDSKDIPGWNTATVSPSPPGPASVSRVGSYRVYGVQLIITLLGLVLQLDDSAWADVVTSPLPAGMVLSADAMEPTRRHSSIPAVPRLWPNMHRLWPNMSCRLNPHVLL